MMMPAAHKPQYHNCFPGGYVDHVNRVIQGALKIDRVWREMDVIDTYSTEELVFSALNHDLGKFGTFEEEAYLPQTDQWRREKLNEPYMFNDRLEFMSVPDRGLYGEGRFSYSINNTQSIVVSASVVATATPENFRYDSNYSASAGTYWQVAVPTSSLAYVDKEGVAAFQLINKILFFITFS